MKTAAQKEYRRVTAFRRAEKRRKAVAKVIDLLTIAFVCVSLPLFLVWMLCFVG